MSHAAARTTLTLCALAIGACNDISYPVSPTLDQRPQPVLTRLTLLVSPGQLPTGGGTATINIETSDHGSTAVPGVRVTLTATSGELEQNEIVTDGTGHAAIRWRVTRSSTVTGTAAAITTQAVLTVQ